MKLGEHSKVACRSGLAGLKSQSDDLLSRPLVIGLLLALVTLFIYWPARHFDFLGYDDPGYFSENAHVLAGPSGNNVLWAFTTGDAANWHPLTWLSLMLDAEVFGNNPQGPHLVNLLFHAANAVLVFLLFRQLTALAWRSALVAALFALHPLHVESVAWIAERKDLLCAFFWLPTLMAYARYVALAKVRSAKSKNFYVLALFLFALALMSKPMAVTLPFLLLLLDWWPLNRISNFKSPLSNSENWHIWLAAGKPLLLEKIPFFALSAAASLVTFVVQQKGDAVASLATFPFSARIENAFVSYARYLGKTLCPVSLANPYPHPGYWPFAFVVLSVLLFALLCGLAVGAARKYPFVFTGWFWFAGMLVPVIGLVQVGNQAMADRYSYLPVIGLFVILVWGLARLAASWNIPKAPATGVVVLILLMGAVKTREQLSYWQNDGTLFGHALAVTENNYVASINLGSWLSKNGQVQAALDHYYAALKMSPADPVALYDVGNAFARLGNLDEAVADYRRALQLAPDRPNLLNNLGCVLMEKKQLPEAITNFEAVLKIKPDFADAENNLATALFKLGRYEESARHFYVALKLAPDNAQICSNLGDALARLGKLEAAAECYQQALQMEPDDRSFAAKLKALQARMAK